MGGGGSSGGSSGSGSSRRLSACGVGAIWLLLACFAKVAGVFLERLHRAFQLQRGQEQGAVSSACEERATGGRDRDTAAESCMCACFSGVWSITDTGTALMSVCLWMSLTVSSHDRDCDREQHAHHRHPPHLSSLLPLSLFAGWRGWPWTS